MEYLQKLHDFGVVNIEMECTIFAALTHHAGIRSAIVCVALLNRLNGDQVSDVLYFPYSLIIADPVIFAPSPAAAATRWMHRRRCWTNGNSDLRIWLLASSVSIWPWTIRWSRWFRQIVQFARHAATNWCNKSPRLMNKSDRNEKWHKKPTKKSLLMQLMIVLLPAEASLFFHFAKNNSLLWGIVSITEQRMK